MTVDLARVRAVQDLDTAAVLPARVRTAVGGWLGRTSPGDRPGSANLAIWACCRITDGTARGASSGAVCC